MRNNAKNSPWGILTFKKQKDDTQQAVGALLGESPHLSNREGASDSSKEKGQREFRTTQ